jgi:ParB/RepB/Spo0J family partition protein
MRVYQAVTGHRDIVDYWTEHPPTGDGWKIAAENEDAEGELHVRIVSPEGKDLGRFRLTEKVLTEITPAIRKDMGEDPGPSAMPTSDEQQERRQYRGTTGNERAAQVLSVYQADTWELRTAFYRGAADEHVQLLDGMKVITNVPIEPRNTLVSRVSTALHNYTQVGTATPATPVPLICVRNMPTGAWLVTLWLSGEELKETAAGQGADEVFMASRLPSGYRDMLDRIEAWRDRYQGARVESDVNLAALETAASMQPARSAKPEDAARARTAREIGHLLQSDATKLPGDATVEPRGEQNRVPDATSGDEALREIPLDEIGRLPGGNQRTVFDQAKLEELAASIRIHGVVEPIIVNEVDGHVALIAGERRLLAARMAGLTTIPSRVKHLPEEEALQLMLVENIMREDLNPMDEARAYHRLLQCPGINSPGDVADRVGRSRPHVAEYLTLLDLPLNLQNQVIKRELGVKAALAFIRETRQAPTPVRERVAQVMEQQRPSIREAPKIIGRVMEEEGVARATPGKGAGQNPDKGPVSPDRTAIRPAESGRQTADPPAHRVDPQVERARALAQVGRGLWGKHSAWYEAPSDQVMFERECYLPLDRVLKHWELRQELGATTIPRTTGATRVEIPEQNVWFRGYDEASTGGGCNVEIKGTKLIIDVRAGGVEATYVGSPVYYRLQLVASGNGGSKHLRQQLVIQDGGRNIVLTGGATVLCRKELVPNWADLVNELPGLPAGADGQADGPAA